jgi:hypothetical protein
MCPYPRANTWLPLQLVLGAASHLRDMLPLAPGGDSDGTDPRMAMCAAHRAHLLAVPPLCWFLPRACAS